MYSNYVLPHSVHVQLLKVVHEEIIIPVGKQSISVDEGFSKTISMLYRTNTHLSLTYSEKLNYLLELSCITYPLSTGELSPSNEILLIQTSFLNGMVYEN